MVDDPMPLPREAPERQPRLFELDVREMFPRLDRHKVWEGMRYLVVRKALKEGVHGGRKVHKHTSKLDRILRRFHHHSGVCRV